MFCNSWNKVRLTSTRILRLPCRPITEGRAPTTGVVTPPPPLPTPWEASVYHRLSPRNCPRPNNFKHPFINLPRAQVLKN